MTLPASRETQRDFGTGAVAPASMTPIVFGVSPLGARNALEWYSSPSTLFDARGDSAAVQHAANLLARGGGPIGFIGADPSIAAENDNVLGYYGDPGTIGTVTNTGGGPTVTLTGALRGSYAIRIEITTGGALGVGQFRWSLDGGATWEETARVLAATYVLGDTGITANFAAGTYVLAATYAATATAGGGTLAVSGDATLDALVRVEIMASGGLGEGRFRYCLDGYEGDTASERTYSETLTIPAGGTFAIPRLGTVLTFDDSDEDFVAGDYYLAAVRAPAFNSADIAEAIEVLRLSPARWRFVTAVTTKGNGDATAHALLTAALNSGLASLASLSKYRRGMIPTDRGDSPAAVVSAFQSVVATRCLVAHGEVRRTTTLAFPGFAFPVTSAIDVIAARACASLISADLKRVKSGALEEVVKLFHDERQTPTLLDDVKVTTLRTYENRDGYYIAQGRLKSPAGSDYRYWPHGLIMDAASEIVHEVLTEAIGQGLRYETKVVNNQRFIGTVDDRDASTLEQEVNRRLAAVLLSPVNVEGTPGHVTGLLYKVNPLHNAFATGIILGSVAIQSLLYVDGAETDLGFVVELPNAA